MDLSGLRLLEGSLQRRKDILPDVIGVNLSFFEYGYGFEDALGFFEARLRHHESERARDTVRVQQARESSHNLVKDVQKA
jgi:hypothetical protein